MAKDLLVESNNPEMLDNILNQFGAVLIGAPNYIKKDGYYVMRVLEDNKLGFIRFACDQQGYCKIIKELPELI